MGQVAEIIRQPEAENRLNKQLRTRQLSDSCDYKYSRLKWKMKLLIKNVYCNDGINKIYGTLWKLIIGKSMEP